MEAFYFGLPDIILSPLLSFGQSGSLARTENGRERLMKISARNQLKGNIVEIVKGATTAHVRIDINGTVVTAAITNESVDELKLKVGKEAYAVVKASDVMVAVK
jgi:molybdopterin-binding protein